MRLKYFFYIIFIHVIVACNVNENRGIIYNGRFTDADPVSVNRLNDTFPFSFPTDIYVSDSLVVVVDAENHDKILHLFSKESGEFLCSAINKGRGPNEVLVSSSSSIVQNAISVFDAQSMKIVYANINNNDFLSLSTIELKSPFMISSVIPYGNNLLLKGYQEAMLFGLYDISTAELNPIYNDYTAYTDNDEVNRAITDYSVKVRYNSKTNKLVYSTYIGGSLYCVDLIDSKIHPIWCNHYFEPKYDIVQGTTPLWVSPSLEGAVGFQDLCLTENFVYGALWGCSLQEMLNNTPQIIKLDVNTGKTKEAYIPEDKILCFTIDSNNILYGVFMNDDGLIYLGKSISEL